MLPCKDMDNAEINNGKAYVSDGNNEFIVDKKTVFVDVDGEKAYIGYDEVPDVSEAKLAYVLDNKVAEVVFIIEGEFYDNANTYFMLSKTDRESFKHETTSIGTSPRLMSTARSSLSCMLPMML